MNQYEAMFLLDPTFGSSLENCETEIRRLMDRAKAEVVFIGKWDERRLAYRIKGRKRGVYVLVYFKAAPEHITGLQRDAQISEEILRMLVLRADGVTREMMEESCASHGADRSSEEDKSSEDAPRGKRERNERETVASGVGDMTVIEGSDETAMAEGAG